MIDGEPSILVLNAACLDELLDAEDIVASQEQAFMSFGDGFAALAPRLLVSSGEDTAFCYASRLSPETGPVAKFGSVNPANRRSGLPTVSAVVIALDPLTGQVAALLDGHSLTVARTAAASALAAKRLAPTGACRLAILGSGVQAGAHARVFAAALDLTSITLWSPEPTRRERLAAELTQELSIPVLAASSPDQALVGATLVLTATISRSRLFPASALMPGATVISVGSFAPHHREVGPDVVAASHTFVDHRETALRQAGPIVDAVGHGVIDASSAAELSAVLGCAMAARCTPDDLVYYNSVGLGIQDAAAAWLAIRLASERGVGVKLELCLPPCAIRCREAFPSTPRRLQRRGGGRPRGCGGLRR